MVFSSILFLFIFLPFTLLTYYLVPKSAKNSILLIFSMLFYFWGSKKLIFLVLISILLNYLIGLLLGSLKNGRRLCFWSGVAINLSILFYFKYFNFFVDSLNSFFVANSINPVVYTKVVLPIGISFFTFHALSYIIDLYWGKIKVQKNIFDFALYITLFPQLIAGPIIRYRQISPSLHEREYHTKDFLYGISRFIQGLGKKVIIANGLGTVADKIFDLNPMDVPFSVSWIGAICYFFQIYYDFSGYSDMAIGLGKMLGFTFPENFNYPYISKSITEFWRRWHISLSTWFRDYLYIPMGGSRTSKIRTYLNLWTIFILCGLWHGASFNFLIWGVYYGFFLVLERLLLKKWLAESTQFIHSALQHIYTIFVIMIGWVLFRSESLDKAIIYLKSMFGFFPGRPDIITSYFLDGEALFFLFLALICSTPAVNIISKRFKETLDKEVSMLSWFRISYLTLKGNILLLIFLYSVILLSGSTYNPFIYFRF